MCWRYNILKKLKTWKKDGKMLQFINKRRIANGVEQEVVLGISQFLVAITRITDDIEELIKIIGYADDWMVHTTHQHQRVATIQIQKQ
jgi:hypothetical protein